MNKIDLTKLTKSQSRVTEQFRDKKRAASQRIFDSLPMKIDAIKAEREKAAKELRRFVMEREKNGGS